MAAQNHEWTLNEIGRSEAAVGDRHKTEGQVDFTPSFTEARQMLPSNVGPQKKFEFHPSLDRQELPDPRLSGDVPDPGCGYAGVPLDFGAVGPDTDRGVTYDLEGVDAPPAHGTGVLFRGGGPLD